MRMSRQAVGRKNTSRTASCCSWSSSPSSTADRATPKRSAPKPTDCSTDGWSQSSSFGPTIPAFDSLERDVVVEKEEEPRALDEADRLVRGRAEAGVGADDADDRRRHLPPDAGDQRLVEVVAGQEEDRAQVRIVLRGEASEHLVEPRTRFMDDDDGDNRGCSRRAAVGHGRSRLVGTLARLPAGSACKS
jgi:hypothetical protein